jgi:hypothetical protein
MKMGELLFDASRVQRFSRTSVVQSVLSFVAVSAGEIQSIAQLLEPISHGTAEALRAIRIDPNLFKIPGPQ